jgi:AAA+ superfamily predicted ATPase
MLVSKYQNHLEYVNDILERFDILLNIHIKKFQKIQSFLYKDVSFNDVVVSDGEIEAILKNTSKAIDIYDSLEQKDDEIINLKDKLKEKENEIDKKVKETQNQQEAVDEPFFFLPHLINVLNLTQIEIEAIISCLALQVDSQITKKYERIYAYLNDNLSKKKPTANLLLATIYSSLEDRIKNRYILSKDSKLFKYHILQVVEDDDGNNDSYDIFDQSLRLDDEITRLILFGMTLNSKSFESLFSRVLFPDCTLKNYVHSNDSFKNSIVDNNDNDDKKSNEDYICIDGQLLIYDSDVNKKINSICNLVSKTSSIGPANTRDNELQILSSFADFSYSLYNDHQNKKAKFVFNLYGQKGSGKKSLARFFCTCLGVPLLMVDVAKIICQMDKPMRQHLQKIKDLLYFELRNAVFFGYAVYFVNFDSLFEIRTKEKDNDESFNFSLFVVESVSEIIKEMSWLVFIETSTFWNHDGIFNDCFFANLEVKIPTSKTRSSIWNAVSKRECKSSVYDNNDLYRCDIHLDDDINFDVLASKFAFTPGQIHNAFIFAKNMVMAKDHGDESPTITMEDLYHSCKVHSNQGLNIVAKKINPNYTWNDIVLPLSSLNILKDICNAVTSKATIYSDWGFGKKFSLGKGMTALFTGETGTGKTMATEVIAKELNLDIYKCDLSSILSKYIGETEKNLNTVFKESEGSNSILFFDEADALFGKRTDVKDSHDKYANIETNYLLQKIDEFEGVVILSTNYRRNIDEAFIRRMQFVVDFPFPKAEYRLEIWEKSFPSQMPKADDIDFDFLANNLQISGGNIKNIVINSAFLAAKNGKPVCMQDIVLATKREFEKIGRPIQRASFGKYSKFFDEFVR